MRRRGCIIRGMGVLLAVSMCVTEGLLLMQGRWREAIPLHLCSVSAIVAFFVSLGAQGDALDFLWYLGLPGALLALIFPAPAVSSHQALFNASYAVTHALIMLIPLAAIAEGARPREGRAARMLLLLHGLAFTAFFVNEALGTDFLFLSAPPSGTPLEPLFALGYPVYLLFLEGMMIVLCLVQSAAAHRLTRLFEAVQIRKNAL